MWMSSCCVSQHIHHSIVDSMSSDNRYRLRTTWIVNLFHFEVIHFLLKGFLWKFIRTIQKGCGTCITGRAKPMFYFEKRLELCCLNIKTLPEIQLRLVRSLHVEYCKGHIERRYNESVASISRFHFGQQRKAISIQFQNVSVEKDFSSGARITRWTYDIVVSETIIVFSIKNK